MPLDRLLAASQALLNVPTFAQRWEETQQRQKEEQERQLRMRAQQQQLQINEMNMRAAKSEQQKQNKINEFISSLPKDDPDSLFAASRELASVDMEKATQLATLGNKLLDANAKLTAADKEKVKNALEQERQIVQEQIEYYRQRGNKTMVNKLSVKLSGFMSASDVIKRTEEEKPLTAEQQALARKRTADQSYTEMSNWFGIDGDQAATLNIDDSNFMVENIRKLADRLGQEGSEDPWSEAGDFFRERYEFIPEGFDWAGLGNSPEFGFFVDKKMMRQFLEYLPNTFEDEDDFYKYVYKYKNGDVSEDLWNRNLDYVKTAASNRR